LSAARQNRRTGLRRRAERRLKQRQPDNGRARIEADAQRLVHELQVHEVELEMQNAELKDARDRAEVLLNKYTDLYEFAPVGYFSLTASGRIQLVNLAGARLVGSERARLLGRTLSEFVAAESRAMFKDFLARVFADRARHSCELVLLARAEESSRTVSIEAERMPGDLNCRAVMTDITARKQAEAAQRRVDALTAANVSANQEIAHRHEVEKSLRESERIQRRLVEEAQELHAQLRHMARQILVAQEEERKNISRELHDEIAQILAGINVQLAALAGGAASRPRDLRARIARTQRLVAQSVAAVHRFARELRPAMLDDLGLVPALRAFIRDLPGRKGLKIRLTADTAGAAALDNTQRTVLYRVAQEALTNVIRHAHAQLATVRVHQAADSVRLVVHDNGKSFAVDHMLATNTKRRLGLLGMRERVEMVGGKFSIESAPGAGTTVRVTIPFRGARRGPNP
jgi:PAS domain S-box-containing protein